MSADSRGDAELGELRRDGDLRRLGFGFLRLPGGQLVAVHARYTPRAGIRAATAEELRRRIVRDLGRRPVPAEGWRS